MFDNVEKGRSIFGYQQEASKVFNKIEHVQADKSPNELVHMRLAMSTKFVEFG